MDGGQQTGRKAGGSVPPARPALRPGQGDLQRLEAALRIVAGLVIENPVYAPIFRRLEREIALEKQAQAADVIARARAVIAQNESNALIDQNEIGTSNSAACSSEAPKP
ncbi:hypothetical protein ACTTAK_06260 [Rhodobacter capsulatus]|jgi:hypothetical protein|uniref:Uncharacterized protein n=1 Tax=Rhodobacter capsulatus (strain ATCC BAA-309 / NBRC 16581 / SB1003) TaxID=272942 RepID=D5ASD1_RHOCB|nr:conserved hypothetical protein [Rhodobacter capsulatus SB 1003]